MNNIFLIGNGFDLHHKLPTRYDCFLHTLDFLREHYNESMKTIGDIWCDERIFKNNPFIAESYKRYHEGYNTTIIPVEKITELIRIAKENVWFSHLMKSYNCETKWIDFEKEITQVLNAFREFFAKCNSKKFSLAELELSDEHRYYISQFDFFYTEPDQSIVSNNNQMRVKWEYIQTKPYGSKIFTMDKNAIVKELFKSLSELTQGLQIYLSCFIENAVEILIEKNMIEYRSFFKSEAQIISFNYTNTFEKLYAPNEEICHIHGSLDNQLVLGINSDFYDEIENIDTTFIAFKKYFQRVFYQTDIGYYKKIQEIRDEIDAQSGWIHKDEFTLYVIGHSLDITDREVIFEVFDLAGQINILYHTERDIGTYISNLVNIYGKKGFDKLRIEKNLRFYSLSETTGSK